VRYQETPIPRAEAKRALAQDDPDLDRIVLAVALHDPEVEWAEHFCLAVAANKDPGVRGNAILGFGHLARRFGRVPASALPLVVAALKDSNEHVRGQAHSAAHDIEHFTAARLHGGEPR
jgi:hypothetical protein